MHTPLIKFKESKPADLLLAYCRKHDIQCAIEKQSDGFLIVLMDETQLSQAVELTKEFLAQPNADKFQEAAWESGEAASETSSITHKMRFEGLADWQRNWFTTLVSISCILIFVLMSIGFGGRIFEALQIQYVNELSTNYQWYRVFGPNFMHGSLIHLLFNLIWWWVLGRQIESIFGSVALIVLFTVATLAANFSQLLVSGPNFLGLSGVVYALFGFVWWLGWLRPKWGLGLSNALVGFLLIWLVLGYANVLGVSMANQAHTFGLISGCALAWILHKGTYILKR